MSHTLQSTIPPRELQSPSVDLSVLGTAPDPAIEVRDVYKSFDRRQISGGYTTFKTQLIQLFNKKRALETIKKQRLEVLKGLTFNIMPGDTVGIIGQNGAGKSTLLKLLTGIYRPDRGSVVKRGRMSPLLELGAGFHPEFSGRENIYMNGMILGLTRRELREREDEIIRFAELEEFIDAPVRTYSSGMYMRLAFAVAVNVDPDILVIDEILAVGDEHFQHKSGAKLDEFKAKKIAIVLVTHNLGTVATWCNRAIWLDAGRIAAEGDPRMVVERYRARVAELEETARRGAPGAPADAPKRPALTIRQLRTLDHTGGERQSFRTHERIALSLQCAWLQAAAPVTLHVSLRTAQNELVFESKHTLEPTSGTSGELTVSCEVPGLSVVCRGARLEVFVQDARAPELTADKLERRLDIVDYFDTKTLARVEPVWRVVAHGKK